MNSQKKSRLEQQFHGHPPRKASRGTTGNYNSWAHALMSPESIQMRYEFPGHGQGRWVLCGRLIQTEIELILWHQLGCLPIAQIDLSVPSPPLPFRKFYIFMLRCPLWIIISWFGFSLGACVMAIVSVVNQLIIHRSVEASWCSLVRVKCPHLLMISTKLVCFCAICALISVHIMNTFCSLALTLLTTSIHWEATHSLPPFVDVWESFS